jgi:hypothetical protein
VKEFKYFNAKFQRGHWPRRNDFSGVDNPVQTISASSLTPPKRYQRGHWQHWNDFSRVIDPAEIQITPLKFYIIVLVPQLFHREISLYHFLTLKFKQKKVGEF